MDGWKKRFNEFLEVINSAPSLKTEKSTEDVELMDSRLVRSVEDLIDIASDTQGSTEKDSARKALEALATKGYASAQLRYGDLLANEGNVEGARTMYQLLENNAHVSESQTHYAQLLLEGLPKKSNRQFLAENSEKPKEPSFLEMVNSAKNLNDVSEADLSTEMGKVGKSIIDKYAKMPYSAYTPDDVKALEGLSDKGYPRAQEFLSWYYEDRGQYSKAFGMANKLRRNPYSDEAFQDAGAERVKKLLPMAKKEATIKYDGR